MNNRQRADEFVRFIGLELKGAITAQGFTAKYVADELGRSASAFNKYLNGKQELPLAALCEAAEIIDLDPTVIVERAYDRLAVTHGDRDGDTYGADVVEQVRQEEALRIAGDYVPGDAEKYGLAAHEGVDGIGMDDLPNET
ncbi:MAG: helix-turn-helix domain-containing protein [Arthrobacter sp.]|jgi:transcriptional regulator with XRE-family HTH domain|nr:helix-turn-helix domain-containing protein [Arthrobacter sp.]